jgi:hypothetical protein
VWPAIKDDSRSHESGVRTGIVVLFLLGKLLSGFSVWARASTFSRLSSKIRFSKPQYYALNRGGFYEEKLDTASDFLKDEKGLSVGVSKTTSYQTDSFISTRGGGRVVQPFGVTLTDPSMRLFRTRLLLRFARVSKRPPVEDG